MTFLDYAKQYHNFDVFLVLIDDAGYTDEEIMEKFQISKQRIYEARKRLDSLIQSLTQVEPYKRDGRDPNIQSIIDAFLSCFGTTSASKYDRYAAKRLHVKYGAEKIVNIIQALSQKAGEPYAPTINSVSDLEKKWPQVGQFLNRQTNDRMVDL